MFLRNLNLVSPLCNYYLIFYSINCRFLSYQHLLTGYIVLPVGVSQRPVCYRQGIQPGTAGKGHSLALLGVDRSSGFPVWHWREVIGDQVSESGTAGSGQELRVPSLALLGGDRSLEFPAWHCWEGTELLKSIHSQVGPSWSWRALPFCLFLSSWPTCGRQHLQLSIPTVIHTLKSVPKTALD